MKGPFRFASGNLKIILLIIAVLLSIATLFYTQKLVKKLQSREKQIVELYANSLKYISNPNNKMNDYTFLLDNIVKKIDFPLILTDADGNVSTSKGDKDLRNLIVDSTLTEEQRNLFLEEKIKELESINDPIEVTLNDTTVLNKIYYGESELVKDLRTYPYFQILIAVLFILIAYISFSFVKQNEQSNIWIGMAKETAHQLGTPISSLMGWYEYLKISYTKKEKVLEIAEEINSDLTRLNKVANRFSKIGSKPALQKVKIVDLLNRVMEYFHKRIPQTGKNVEININSDINPEVNLNAELFEWVIENLIKNSLDAIGRDQRGKIDINIIENSSNIFLEVEDNGKGINSKRKKDVFRPGYSTKRRGWGLGLSLSKRIIENYHNGKIFVKSSSPGKGTIFQITLNK